MLAYYQQWCARQRLKLRFEKDGDATSPIGRCCVSVKHLPQLTAMNDRIAIDPEIQHGKPVIRGTRVPVARILGGLAGGMSIDEIVGEYEVTIEDIRAAIGYAEELVEQESHHPLPA